MNNTTGINSYKIERITKQNLPDLEKLYISVYHKKHFSGFYFKKYSTDFTGKKYIGFIAYDNKNYPIGHFSILPCWLQYENKILLAGQAVDAMTVPSYRKKGLFPKLLSQTFDLCNGNNVQLLFGFPNQDSYMPMIRSGWKETEKMSRFTIPLRRNFISSLLRRSSFLQKGSAWEFSPVLQSHVTNLMGLPSSAVTEGYAGVSRNDEYLKYRQYNKTVVIEINDSKVWLKISRGDLIIGDIELKGNEQKFTLLIERLKDLATDMRLDKIHFQISSETRLSRLFACTYKAIPSYPVLFWDFGRNFYLHKFKFTFADIDIF